MHFLVVLDNSTNEAHRISQVNRLRSGTFIQINNMKLFVAGLPNDFDDTDLKEMFELYGDIVSAKFIVDRATGKSKGFAFVDMPNKTEAQETIEALDGATIKGKKIVVKEAEQKPRNDVGRSNNNRFNRW